MPIDWNTLIDKDSKENKHSEKEKNNADLNNDENKVKLLISYQFFKTIFFTTF